MKRKFKMTLVQGGGNSFCEALRNTGNKIDIGVDEVLFKVGGEDGENGRKPVAVEILLADDPSRPFVVGSRGECKDEWEECAFSHAMALGDAFVDGHGAAVPIFQGGKVEERHMKMLKDRFGKAG